MTHQQSETVNKRAFSLWEAAGKPHGHALDHWLQAEREIGYEAKLAGPRKKTTKSPRATKPKTTRKRTRAKNN